MANPTPFESNNKKKRPVTASHAGKGGKSAKIANFLKNQQKIKHALNTNQTQKDYLAVDRNASVQIEGQIDAKIKDLENRYRLHAQNF